MIKKYKNPIVCDKCGATKVYEYVSLKNAINREICLCKKCAISEGIIEESEEEILSELSLISPKAIYEKLDSVVIGQQDAKKKISIEVFNHLLRLKNKDKIKKMGKTIKKNNILLTGPSGTGKTLLAQTIAQILDVPFYIGNASSYTQAGYVGEDVENLIVGLLQSSDYNIKRCEKGIIFIDEVDKIAKKGESLSITRDVSGEGVQQTLLKMIEGTIAKVPPNGGRKHPDQKFLDVNTEDILFICGGAFVGIEDIVKNRLQKANKHTSTIGFGATNTQRKEYSVEELRSNITVEDLQ